jgi:hypothetical protein
VPTTKRRTKRLVMLAAIAILGIIGREFFNAFYIFREVLFVLSFAALAVFFATGLMVLAIVSHSAWQNLFTLVRKTGAGGFLQGRLTVSAPRPLTSRGVYERANRVKA